MDNPIFFDQVYNENCLDTLARLPAGTIDLTVTSPPYDNLRHYNGYNWNVGKVIRELYRTTKDGGIVVWVVADQVRDNSESGSSMRQALLFQEYDWNILDTMIWVKNALPLSSLNAYYQSFEFMFVFCKGRPRVFTPIKDVKTKERKPARLKVKKMASGYQNKYWVATHDKIKRGNVWFYPVGTASASDKCAFDHPAIFPGALAYDHIISWSNPGDLVYDPFAGSGTTLKQALLADRHYLGSEISADYCAIIDKRLQEYKPQTRLPNTR